jgi:aspartate carbamoyltransferase catalytic subunit
MKNPFYQKDIISCNELTKEDIAILFETASDIRKRVTEGKSIDTLAGKILSLLFFEPSSRTFSSFVSAMQRLGGGIIPITDVSHTSLVKGETFEDTVTTFSRLSDTIVIRHPREGSAKDASAVSDIPVINAGDGAGEHPTQALLDVFTILDHFKDMSSLRVTLAGDLLYGRTVHSLIRLLGLFHVSEIRLVSPTELQMPEDLVSTIQQLSISVSQTQDLADAISDTDVLYMTRVQKERFTDPLGYERLKDSFVITPETMKHLPKNAILMHPLPRIHEIAKEVDSDSRSMYFREQIPNGMYIRMALLSLILKK